MFEVEPTKTQLNQFEKNYSMKDVKLTAGNVKEIIFTMEVGPTTENILFSYATGKGKYSDYSRDYLKKKLEADEIKQYKDLERQFKKDLEEAIRKYRHNEYLAQQEAEMERYRERARALVRDGDIDAIARALRTEAHQYDGVDPRLI